MCNVYSMYSFEVTKTPDGKYKPETAPFQGCWGDQFAQISS